MRGSNATRPLSGCFSRHPRSSVSTPVRVRGPLSGGLRHPWVVHRFRARLPRRTIRVRLALLCVGVFLASGVAMLTVTVAVWQSTTRVRMVAHAINPPSPRRNATQGLSGPTPSVRRPRRLPLTQASQRPLRPATAIMGGTSGLQRPEDPNHAPPAGPTPALRARVGGLLGLRDHAPHLVRVERA
jgi:hypothetical protein